MNKYVKVLLYLYPRIDRHIKNIDKIVLDVAINSSGLKSNYPYFINTMEEVNTILELTEEKKKLIGIVDLIDNYLGKLSKIEKKIIENKYFHKVRYEDMTKEYGCSKRTYFRKVVSIIDKLRALMEKDKKDFAWFKKEYEDVKCVKLFYQLIEEKEKKEQLERLAQNYKNRYSFNDNTKNEIIINDSNRKVFDYYI